MAKKLQLTTFQIGGAPQPGQGLRIGITRRPPRGVPKDRWVADGYFDVWMPALAPTAEQLADLKNYDLDNPAQCKKFFDRYEKELLSHADTRQTVEFVAQIAACMPIAIGCFCQDESRCHRSRLFKILQDHAPAE
jgi:uncharacterized protein YeaO (DUF488 family)